MSPSERHEQILGKSPRIDPPETLPSGAVGLLAPPAGYEQKAGPAPLLWRMMLHNPRLLEAFRPIASHFLLNGTLSPRDRELAVLRIAWLNQAPFVWGEHVQWGHRVGLTSEEIDRVTAGSSRPGWTEHEAAMIRAVDELHDDAMISDETWAALAKTLTPGQLIEIPALVGLYQMLAYIQDSVRLPLWEGNSGLCAR